MLTSFSIDDHVLKEQENYLPGHILCLVNPNTEETARLRDMTGLDESVIGDALDRDERPRIEVGDNVVYIVFRAPWIEGNEEREDFTTPVTIAFTPEHTVIISPNVCGSTQKFFFDQKHHPHLLPTRARIMAMLFETITDRFLLVLREFNTAMKGMEKSLGKMSDTDQLRLLHMQNTLVYFQAALRSNEMILDRILRTRLRVASSVTFDITDDDIDFFDDTLTDIRQGAYVSQIYAEVLDCLMRVNASVIGGRVNTIMKVLTSLTLVLMVPTLVTSAYGMNVNLPFQNTPGAFMIVGGLSLAISLVAVWWLWHKGWFSQKD